MLACMQVIHYDLRCGMGTSQQQQQQQQRPAGGSSSSRSGSRLQLLLCHGYSKAQGPTNRVSCWCSPHICRT
jgi:hypothetical protein